VPILRQGRLFGHAEGGCGTGRRKAEDVSKIEHSGNSLHGKVEAERDLVMLAERHWMPQTTTTIPPTEAPEGTRSKRRILLVDDSESMRKMLALALEDNDFEVAAASNVNEALKLIGSRTFDVLLSDLQMPDAGDGLTVVSAMRHSNPKAVTFIFSGYPEMNEAARAILMQTDEVLTKPLSTALLVKAINDRLRLGAHPVQKKEDVAGILENETHATISQWLNRVDAEPEIISVRLTAAERSAHLPAIFHDLVERLRHPLPLGTRALKSPASVKHGLLRREQGYTPAMMVEESRMLQVSIFQTLQENLQKVDFSVLLVDVMAIADEVDSQLAQAMTSYVSTAHVDARPIES
jgi:DNA-binding response OmpR family regulator